MKFGVVIFAGRFIFTLFSPQKKPKVHVILVFLVCVVSVAVRVPLFLPALVIFQPSRVEESVIFISD